jgi:hypothetical protein
MDQLVMDYRSATKASDISDIYTKIRNVYLPKVMAMASTFPSKYRNEIISEYDYQLIQHIRRWTGVNKITGKKCSAKSYLYWAVLKAHSVTVNHIKKDKRVNNVAELMNDILSDDCMTEIETH